MTIANLWSTCGNWTPFSKVHIYTVITRSTFNYSYFEDVLHDWADSRVITFNYDASTDTMCIHIK